MTSTILKSFLFLVSHNLTPFLLVWHRVIVIARECQDFFFFLSPGLQLFARCGCEQMWDVALLIFFFREGWCAWTPRVVNAAAAWISRLERGSPKSMRRPSVRRLFPPWREMRLRAPKGIFLLLLTDVSECVCVCVLPPKTSWRWKSDDAFTRDGLVCFFSLDLIYFAPLFLAVYLFHSLKTSCLLPRPSIHPIAPHFLGTSKSSARVPFVACKSKKIYITTAYMNECKHTLHKLSFFPYNTTTFAEKSQKKMCLRRRP